MPTVTAYPYPALGRVLVEIDWADTNWATCARAVRNVVSTGATAALRSYIAPCGTNGEYQELSGGRAIFWDNECPLDTPVYYTTDAVTSTGTQVVAGYPPVVDTFTRTVAAGGWGTATSGQSWVYADPALSVNGTQGLMSHNAGTFQTNQLSNFDAVKDIDVYIDMDAVTPTGAGTSNFYVFGRYNSNSFVRVETALTVGGNTAVAIVEYSDVSGTFAAIQTSPVIAISGATAGDPVTIRLQLNGTLGRGKAWKIGTPEPDWLTLPNPLSYLCQRPGGFIVQEGYAAGWTNAPPIVTAWDNLLIQILNVTGPTITATSATVTLVSNNNLWLRDPGRPCDDLVVQLCFSAPCASGSGVAFMGIDTETYDANTVLLMPTNAKFPIPINRLRRDAATTLTLATKTFADRNALLTFLAPGDPVLFSAPSVYGMPDRYMSIQQASVAHGLTDLRISRRIETLPFTTVERPITTQQGTCNAQFSAMCNIYSTWTTMATAGITWSDVHYGLAGGTGLGFRLWNPGVENVFANWLAVETHGTWGQLKTGA